MSSSDDEKSRPSSEIEELRVAVEGRQLALTVARETNEELRASAVLARAQSDALRVDLELREDEIASLRTDHREALARASRAEAELAEARAAIEALETTLAGRERDVASRDAHVAIAERGIEERDQQLATLRKQLDQSNEQFALFEGEIRTQRAVLESARHTIALRDERMAYLQDTLRGVEQLASGAASVEALPRPQVATAPATAPVPAVAPVPITATAPAPEPSVEIAVAESPALEDATPKAASVEKEPTIDSEPTELAQTEPVEAPAELESDDAVAPETTEQPESESAATEDTLNEPPAPSPAAQAEAAPEPEAAQPFFYRNVPPLITPIFRYWRDREVENNHPDEAVTTVDQLFYGYVASECAKRPDDTIHIWSLGGGDTQSEIRIGALLKEKQIDNFVFHILDSQPKKLRKQRTMIVSGLELNEKFDIHEGELENWPTDSPCDFVVADGSISSAKDPEALLDRIRRACEGGAVLLMTDRIGSSTPLSPAASDAIGAIFGDLSEKQRKNKVEGSTDDEFKDRRESEDDSTTKLLAALLEDRFEFELKLTGGNLIEALVGPEYGPNFKPKEPDDCKIVDQLAALDQRIISSENLAPRFLVAVLRTDPVSEPLFLGCARSA